MAFIAEVRQASSPPSVDQALRREASGTDDPAGAVVAARALERIFAHAAFYAREFFDARRYPHAALTLAVARIIKPADAGACLWQARALAQTGDRPNALQALECAGASGRIPASAVEGDPLLEPLRSDPRYEGAVRRLKGGTG